MHILYNIYIGALLHVLYVHDTLRLGPRASLGILEVNRQICQSFFPARVFTMRYIEL